MKFSNPLSMRVRYPIRPVVAGFYSRNRPFGDQAWLRTPAYLSEWRFATYLLNCSILGVIRAFSQRHFQVLAREGSTIRDS